jgi:hypothetical protein
MGYACEGVELCKHILCVQIGCIRQWRCQAPITIVIHSSCVSREFIGPTTCFCYNVFEWALEIKGNQKKKQLLGAKERVVATPVC